MRLPQTGGCQCGALRYEISQPPKLVYTCHCTACQRLSGSAFGMGLLIPRKEFSLSDREPWPFERVAESGRTVMRWACPECGIWIYGGPKLSEASDVELIR